MNHHASFNRIYRLVWSESARAWVAVAETARRVARRPGRASRRLVAAALSLSVVIAHAAPTGGQVVAGTGAVSQSGTTTTIVQSTPTLALTWQGFNIAPQETVDFIQPSTSAIAINRILGNDPTQIMGRINANAQVYLINPNGILFGRSAQVNVGGLIASTLDLDQTVSGPASSSFSGSRTFSGSSAASVTNEGTINVADGGYVALLGAHVGNQGRISARLGTVALGAGSAITLSFSGDSLLHLQVDQSLLATLAANGGVIQADGGQVLLSAGAKSALLASVVNNTGKIEARTLENHDGTITLLGGMSAGTVDVEGTLDASAPNGGDGGAIETSAATVKVGDDAKVTTAAAAGLTGSWLLDPYDFTVAATGGDITGTALSTLLSSNGVTISTSTGTDNFSSTPNLLYPSSTNGAGTIHVEDAVSWSAHTLTLSAAQDIDINATMSATGTAGLTMTSSAGHVNVGFLTTGVFAGAVNFSASGALLINGHGYTVVSTSAGVAAINASPNGYYALGSNVALSGGVTATAQGASGSLSLPTLFTGTFDGLGHTISGLSTSSQGLGAGLFGGIGSSGVVQNLAVSGTVTIGGGAGGSYGAVLAGFNYGLIRNSYTSGTVNGENGAYGVGGLVGANFGTIFNSHSSATLQGDGTDLVVGGLVGSNYGGSISNSYATGNVTAGSYAGGLVGQNSFDINNYIRAPGSVSSISNSYATGSVSAGSYAGGLVGVNLGSTSIAATIANSYATGAVSAGGSYGVGGLVGALGVSNGGASSQASITNSYSTGAVSAGSGIVGVGGLLGCDNCAPSGVGIASGPGAVTGSFWNKTTSGLTSSAAGNGLTTAQMQTPSNFTTGGTAPNWSTGTWALYSGSYPLLIPDMTPLIVTASNVTKTYDGTAFIGDSSGVWYSVPGAGASLSGTLGYSGTSQGEIAVGGGTFTIIPSGLAPTSPTQLGYYVSFADGTLTLSKLALTGALSTGSSTYGASLVPGTVTFTNKISGDTVTAAAATVTTTGLTSSSGHLIAGNHAGIESVGSALGGAQAGDYTFAGATGNYDVTTLALTGSIATGSSTYGASLAPGSVTFSNAISGDSVTAASATVTTAGLTSSSGHLNAGNHAGIESVGSTLGGADAGNYSFAGATGDYDVSTLALTGSIATGSSAYGASLAPGSVTFSNAIAGDGLGTATIAVNTTGLTSTSGHLIAGNHGGTETISSLSGADSPNYTFSGVSGGYTVSTLALTGSIATGTSTYGAALTPGVATFTNAISGDTVTAASVTVTTTGLTSSSGHLIAGNHTGIESVASTLGGADASNYSFAGAAGNYDVSTLSLTGSIATGSSTYGAAPMPGAVSFANVLSGDTVTAVGATVNTTGLTSSSGHLIAGSHIGIESAGTSLSGADAGNYSFAGANGNYDVSTLALTGSIATGSSIYGSSLTPGAAAFTNAISGDGLGTATIAVNTTGLTSTSGHLIAGNHNGVESISSLSGADSSNYTFSGVSGGYTVSPLTLTGSIVTGSSTYGSSLAPGAAAFTNVIGGDLLGTVTVAVNTLGLTSGSGNLTAGSHSGIEAVTALSGADSGNYSFSALTGGYTVSPLALSGSIATGTSTYGAALMPGTVTFTNAITGDGVTAVGATVNSAGLTSTSGHLIAGSHVGIESAGTSLSGADAGNYSFAGATGNYDVSTLALTGAIATGNSTYGSALTPGTATFSNAISGDDVTAAAVTLNTTGLTSSSGHLIAGSHSGIESVGSSLSGADAANYSFAGATGNYNVSTLALTGTIGTGGSTYGVGLTPGVAAFTNAIAGDALGTATVAVSTTGLTSGSGNLTAGSHSGIETVTALSGADSGNYRFSGVTGGYTVSPLALTGSIAPGSSTYGAGLTPGTVSFTNVITGDTVTAVGATVNTTGLTSSSGHLIAGNHVGIESAGMSLSGADAGNYSFAGASGNYDVSTLALTGSIATGNSTYGATLTPGAVTLTNAISGDDVTAAAVTLNATGLTSTSGHLIAGNHNGIESVGSSLSGADATNYSFAGATGNYDVGPLALSGSIGTGSSTYGATLTPGTATFTNLIAGDAVTASAATVTTTGLTSTSGHLIAGNHTGIESVASTLGGVDAGNYSFAGATGNYDVSTLALSGSIATGSSTYGAALSPGTVTLMNVVSGDTVSPAAATVTTTGLTSTSGHLIAGNHAGVESVGGTLGGADAGNYSFAGATGNYDVATLALSGSIATGSSSYGAVLTPGAVTLPTVISGDAVTAGLVTIATTGLTSTSGNLVAGNHAGIESVGNTLGGADAGNYSFAGANGNYDVNTLALTGSIGTGSSTYGAVLTPGAVTLMNAISGDSVAAAAPTVNTTGLTSSSGHLIAGNHAGIESVGSSLGGADAGNYSFAGATGNYDVSTLALRVTGSVAADKVYDGSPTVTVLDGTLDGVIAGDSVSLSQAGSFGTKNVGNGIAVATTDSLSGSAASNYTLVQPAGLTANITTAPLNVTGTTAANKTYDGTTTATLAGGTLQGVVGGDAVALNQSGSFATPNAGTGIAISATDSLGGASAGDYSLVEPAGLLAAISPATLTYTANAVTSFAGQQPVLSGVVGGFVPGDTESNATTGSLRWLTPGNLSHPGRYAIDGGGLTASNYSFVQAAGNATALTVTAGTPSQPVLDATAQLQSEVVSAQEALSVQTTTAFAGTVPIRVVNGGLTLPADTLTTN